MEKGAGAVAILLFIIFAAVLAYNGAFYVTGAQWYQSCWAKRVAIKAAGENPISSNPYQAAIWENCESTTLRAVYNAGFVFAGLPASKNDERGLELEKACPSGWKDVPLAGAYLLALTTIQKTNRPGLIDKIMPSEFTIAEAFKERWPHCDEVRRRQGYPRMTETTEGEFGWASPCKVCNK